MSKMAAFSFVGLLVGLTAGDANADSCKAVSGPFTSQFEAGPGCVDSPIGMCTHGVLEGDLEGTYEFSFTSMEPTADDPSVVHYTGTSLITLANGGKQIFGQDTGVMYLGPETTLVTTVSVVGGTKNFKKAEGFITASGTLDFASGVAQGTYTGELCK